jgi:hypothetical protein
MKKACLAGGNDFVAHSDTTPGVSGRLETPQGVLVPVWQSRDPAGGHLGGHMFDPVRFETCTPSDRHRVVERQSAGQHG